MAKRRYTIDEKKIARFIKEGRGRGAGANYKPWLTIQDVPSKGRSHRPFGWKTNRVHHCLSDIEYRVYLILNWSHTVTDIREQFPLDRKKTACIADALGVRHPRQPGERNPMVMTTDFLVVEGRKKDRRLEALAVKTAEDLADERVQEKLEIERRFWNAQGVAFHICVETSLPMVLVGNLEAIYSAWSLVGLSAPRNGYFTQLLRSVLERFPGSESTCSLIEYCNDCDELLREEPGTALFLVKHLIARRRLCADLGIEDLTNMRAAAFHPVDHRNPLSLGETSTARPSDVHQQMPGAQQ